MRRMHAYLTDSMAQSAQRTWGPLTGNRDDLVRGAEDVLQGA
jgi:hypothetical protein